MPALRAFVSVALVLSVSGALLSCTRTVKVRDPDCVSPEALNNVKLIIAADHGDVKVINDLINAGAKANIADDVFGTPLTAAAVGGHDEAVKLLVEKGADVNVPDTMGMTPLMDAAMYGHMEVARFLLTKGANANAVNEKRSGLTALAIAKARKYEAIVKLLEDAGAKK